jgi:branched-chain amino acid transport system permease protein
MTRRGREWSAARVAAGVAALVVVWAVVDPQTRAQFLTGAGIAQGALVAAIALGVVLTYRGSGVVNLASSSIAMYVAYVYAVLRREGDLFLPPLPNPFALIEGAVHRMDPTSTLDLPDWPTRISFGDAMSFWPALVISLLFAVLFGLALHFLVFRPLRDAPPLAKVVASIGLFLYLPAVIIRRFTFQPYTVKPMPFFDANDAPIKLPFGISIGADALTIAVLVIAFTVLLRLVFNRTRFGLATRAAAENEKGAIVLGFSPDFLAGANWVLSTVIIGLLGIFAATIQRSVDPGTLPALIVVALTAALVGGLSSFGWITAAAFILGMQFGLLKYFELQHAWYPSSANTPMPGGERLVPLVVILVILFVRGKSLPTRGSATSGRLPKSPSPPDWAVRYGGPALAAAAAVLTLFVFTPNFRLAMSNTLIGVIICLSVVVITGFVGQISLAQMSFAGISAFLVSKMTTEHGIRVPVPFTSSSVTLIPELPFPFPILIGGLVAMLTGVLVALPALRVRGVNLAIVTLAFAVAVDKVVFGNASVNGGFNGAKVAVPDLIVEFRAVKIDVAGVVTAGDGQQPNPWTTIFCLIVAVVLGYLVVNLRRSATGRKFLALRTNERAAAAAGVNVSGMKVLAFAISAFIAGVGGAVIAYRSGNVTVDKFTYVQSLTFVAFAYIGGIARVSGAVIGGIITAGGLVFAFMEHVLHVPTEFTLILGGLALLIAAVKNPDGIAGSRPQLHLRRRSKATAEAEAGAGVPTGVA